LLDNQLKNIDVRFLIVAFLAATPFSKAVAQSAQAHSNVVVIRNDGQEGRLCGTLNLHW